MIPLFRDHHCPKMVSVSPGEKKKINLFSIAGAKAAFFIKFPKSIWTHPQSGDITRQTLCSELQDLC